MMDWSFSGDRPIWQQLMEKMIEHIVSGHVSPGQKIPPVRELAAHAGVNPNTMQRALAELEREGLLYTNRTSGRFVTEDAARIEQKRESLAKTRIEAFFSGMGQLGYTEQQSLALLRQKEEKND